MRMSRVNSKKLNNLCEIQDMDMLVLCTIKLRVVSFCDEQAGQCLARMSCQSRRI